MKFIYMFLVLILCSCAEHVDILDTSLQVGHIYCSDGSLIHPSLFPGSGKKAVGIVFWRNDGSKASIADIGYAVALEDLDSDYLFGKKEDISDVSEDLSAFDGAANTSAFLITAQKDTVPCPAVTNVIKYAPNGVTGWFLPSVAQTKLISQNINKIYAAFKVVKGKEFNGWYWTSTEDGSGKDTPIIFGLISSLSEGRITNSNKGNIQKVRPIIAIK